MGQEIAKRLPTIEEIAASELNEKEKGGALAVLLNQNPPKQWIKKHPMANTDYLPIERIEFLLTKIFIDWSVEVKEVKSIANSVVVTVRIHYTCPLTGNVKFQDGIGAAPIHTAKGKGAMDWDNIQTDSVTKAAPAAESYAIKDAAEKLGKLFGKDLNRKEFINYEMSENAKKITPNPFTNEQ